MATQGNDYLREYTEQPSVRTTKEGTFGYWGEKREGGQLDKDHQYIVLTESTHNQDKSWVHVCGECIRSKHVIYPVWDNKQPKCKACGRTFSLELPDSLLHCPNCFAPRTGYIIDTKETDMPYCPKCETEPISYDINWLSKHLKKRVSSDKSNVSKGVTRKEFLTILDKASQPIKHEAESDSESSGT